MSIAEMSRIWKDSEQSGNRLLLLLAIADNANDDGYAFPGIAYLAKKTRMSERTVIRMIDDLTASKELIAFRQRTKGNRYMVLSGCGKEEREARIALLSDIIKPISAKMSVISDTVEGKTPTIINQPSIEPIAGNGHKPKTDPVYEAVFWGLTRSEYLPKVSPPNGLANRHAKLLREAGLTDPLAIRAYFADLHAKGFTPTRDSLKVVEGVRAIMEKPAAATFEVERL